MSREVQHTVCLPATGRRRHAQSRCTVKTRRCNYQRSTAITTLFAALSVTGRLVRFQERYRTSLPLHRKHPKAEQERLFVSVCDTDMLLPKISRRWLQPLSRGCKVVVPYNDPHHYTEEGIRTWMHTADSDDVHRPWIGSPRAGKAGVEAHGWSSSGFGGVYHSKSSLSVLIDA